MDDHADLHISQTQTGFSLWSRSLQSNVPAEAAVYCFIRTELVFLC